mgnify:CR=1 FL=1
MSEIDKDTDIIRYIFDLIDADKLREYTTIAVDCMTKDFPLWADSIKFQKKIKTHGSVTAQLFLISQAICASQSFSEYVNKYSIDTNFTEYKAKIQENMFYFVGGFGKNGQKVRPRPTCYCYGITASAKALMSNCKHKHNKIPCCNDQCYGTQHACGDVSALFPTVQDFIDWQRQETFMF